MRLKYFDYTLSVCRSNCGFYVALSQSPNITISSVRPTPYEFPSPRYRGTSRTLSGELGRGYLKEELEMWSPPTPDKSS